MARTLAPIPLDTPITDRDGTITTFFRRRWQDVSEGWDQTPSAARVPLSALTTSVPATRVLTVVTSGVYRVSSYLRLTRPDAVSSSGTVIVQFTDLDGTGLYYAPPALTENAPYSWQGVVMPIRCLAPSDITVAFAYASGTPGDARFDLEVIVEFVP